MKGKVWLYSGSILAVLILGAWLRPWFIQISRGWVKLQQAPSTQVTEKMKFDASLAIAQAIVSGIGTAATIGGGIVLFLNFRVANENLKVANKNAEIANKNAELTESRLITERFSKAVEQLGNDKSAEVRLGGIYSLERLAKDSRADHSTVMEVLTAFVREKSSKFNKTTENRNPKYDADIQAILIVLGRRKHVYSEAFPLDLSQCDLSGFTLKGNFQGANFRDTNLCRTKLEKVDFAKATFTDANLIDADCKNANFSEACLEGTFLCRANFTEAKLINAELGNTRLREAIFVGADFTDATLKDAFFWSCIRWNQRHWSEEDWWVEDLMSQQENSYPSYDDEPEYVRKPNFRESNLTANQAKSASEWEKGIYDDDLRQSLSLPDSEPYRVEWAHYYF